MSDKITRIAIVDANRCKPKRCAQECKKVKEKFFKYVENVPQNHYSHVRWLEWVRSDCYFQETNLIDYDQPGKLCIEVKPTDKIAFISEILCIGCGICVKKYVLFMQYI